MSDFGKLWLFANSFCEKRWRSACFEEQALHGNVVACGKRADAGDVFEFHFGNEIDVDGCDRWSRTGEERREIGQSERVAVHRANLTADLRWTQTNVICGDGRDAA